jgi:hypothetical protein
MSSNREYQHGWQRLLRSGLSRLYNLLPSPPTSDDEYVPGLSGEEVAERRRLRRKIKALEKGGKGGYR